MVTTFTETVAGAIVTVMLVAESVQVEVEVVEEEVVVVFVHVMVVVAAAWLQEAKPSKAMRATRNKRRFTVPRSLWFEIPNSYGSVSTLIPKMA